jgi:hypothetical protein
MTTNPDHDRDGVDNAPDAELHENVRESEEGVESKPVSAGDKPAAGLIGGGASGIGEMTDPRYVGQR